MAAVRPAAAPAAQADDGGFFTSPTFKTLARSAAIYFAIQFAIGPNSPFKSKVDQGSIIPPPNNAATNYEHKEAPVPVAGQAVPDVQAIPLWSPGSLLDVFVKLSTDVDGVVDFQDTSLPSVEWKGVTYDNSKWSREWDTAFDVPESVQHNASLWADVFVTLAGVSPDPASESFGGEEVLHIRKILTRYMPKKKIREVKKLLGPGSKAGAGVTETVPPPSVVEEAEAPQEVMPIISYYHPNVSLEIVASAGALARSALPPPLQLYLNLAHDGKTNEEGKQAYFPLTWGNDFWLLREHMNPVNETTPRLPLRITLTPASFMKWQIMASLDDSFKSQAAATGGGGGEMDEIKRMLTETNPILLVTTVVVTILHMLFEFLAFTSDITHWKNKKELVGVSVRTILTNCFVQLIILLYLLDNNENTSWMILGGQGVGLVIEAWKITKAVDIKVVPSEGTLIPYKLDITDKHVLTADELKTQEYDALAFNFVIKMPILHRLACFRDDVVFVILLYQMYIYKVDPTRVNEYGTFAFPSFQRSIPSAKFDFWSKYSLSALLLRSGQKLTEEESAKLLAAEQETAAALEAAPDADKTADPKKESKKDR
ncbi:hypothetical protein P7C70_g5067, partial [Phenoliferia sp. Uapishka_3]